MSAMYTQNIVQTYTTLMLTKIYTYSEIFSWNKKDSFAFL